MSLKQNSMTQSMRNTLPLLKEIAVGCTVGVAVATNPYVQTGAYACMVRTGQLASLAGGYVTKLLVAFGHLCGCFFAICSAASFYVVETVSLHQSCALASVVAIVVVAAVSLVLSVRRKAVERTWELPTRVFDWPSCSAQTLVPKVVTEEAPLVCFDAPPSSTDSDEAGVCTGREAALGASRSYPAGATKVRKTKLQIGVRCELTGDVHLLTCAWVHAFTNGKKVNDETPFVLGMPGHSLWAIRDHCRRTGGYDLRFGPATATAKSVEWVSVRETLEKSGDSDSLLNWFWSDAEGDTVPREIMSYPTLSAKMGEKSFRQQSVDLAAIPLGVACLEYGDRLARTKLSGRKLASMIQGLVPVQHYTDCQEGPVRVQSYKNVDGVATMYESVGSWNGGLGYAQSCHFTDLPFEGVHVASTYSPQSTGKGAEGSSGALGEGVGNKAVMIHVGCDMPEAPTVNYGISYDWWVRAVCAKYHLEAPCDPSASLYEPKVPVFSKFMPTGRKPRFVPVGRESSGFFGKASYSDFRLEEDAYDEEAQDWADDAAEEEAEEMGAMVLRGRRRRAARYNGEAAVAGLANVDDLLERAIYANTSTVRTAALQALGGKCMRAIDVARAVGLTNKSVINPVLYSLRAEGLVEHRDDGLWVSTSEKPTWAEESEAPLGRRRRKRRGREAAQIDGPPLANGKATRTKGRVDRIRRFCERTSFRDARGSVKARDYTGVKPGILTQHPKHRAEFKKLCPPELFELLESYVAAVGSSFSAPEEVDGLFRIGTTTLKGRAGKKKFKANPAVDAFVAGLLPELFKKDGSCTYSWPTKSNEECRIAFLKLIGSYGWTKDGEAIGSSGGQFGGEDWSYAAKKEFYDKVFARFGKAPFEWPESLSQFLVWVEKTMKDLNWDANIGASSGFFGCSTAKDLKGPRFVEVAKLAYARLLLNDYVMNEMRKEISEVDAAWYVVNGLADPWRVMEKGEPHPERKAKSGKFRCIIHQSVVDMLLNRFAFKPCNQVEIDSFPHLPSMIGVGMDPVHARKVHEVMKEMAGEEDIISGSDLSGFDVHTQGHFFHLDALRRSQGAGGADCGLYWLLSRMACSPVYWLPDGDLFCKDFEGQMPSGWCNTSSTNSFDRVTMSAIARNDPLVQCKAAGDDAFEKGDKDPHFDYMMKEMGQDLRLFEPTNYSTGAGVSWCSTLWKDGTAYPDNMEKHLANIRFKCGFDGVAKTIEDTRGAYEDLYAQSPDRARIHSLFAFLSVLAQDEQNALEVSASHKNSITDSADSADHKNSIMASTAGAADTPNGFSTDSDALSDASIGSFELVPK